MCQQLCQQGRPPTLSPQRPSHSIRVPHRAVTLCGHQGATWSPGLLPEHPQAVTSQSPPHSAYRNQLQTLGNATPINLGLCDTRGLPMV